MENKLDKINLIVNHANMIMRSLRPDKELAIEYREETDETLSRYTQFERQYHGLLSGQEYFYVYQMEDDGKCHLLYAVNVTGDSPLEAAHELFRLLARKF